MFCPCKRRGMAKDAISTSLNRSGTSQLGFTDHTHIARKAKAVGQTCVRLSTTAHSSGRITGQKIRSMRRIAIGKIARLLRSNR